MAFLTPPAFAAWSLLGPSADAQLSIANSAPEEYAPPQTPRQVTTYSAVASPTQAQPGDYQVYPLRHAQANDVDEALVRMLEDFGTRAEVIADSRNNRILIRGNPQTVKMAGQLLETLDRPAAPPPAPRPYLKSYRIPAEELADATRWAQGEFASIQGVRIAADARTSQILVLGPSEVHARMAEAAQDPGALEAQPEATPLAVPPAYTAPATRTASYQTPAVNEQASPAYTAPTYAPPAYSAPAEQVRVAGKVIPLRDSNWQTFEQSLMQMGAQRAPGGEQSPVVEYHVSPTAGGKVVLYIDRRTNQVIIRGTDALADTAHRLVLALDASGQAARGIRVIPVKKSQPATVQQALDTVLTSGVAAEADEAKVDPRKANNPLLARVFQQPPAQPGAAQPPAAQPPAGAQPPDAAGDTNSDATPGRPVRIEYLEGLDIFVLSGPKADVERVRRLIEDIERISETTEPRIQIYPLKFVDSQALSTMVIQLYDQVLSTRQGQVSITPLIKPNSLLLIGRPDSVETVVKLVERLDQPVGPATQFETFRLRHASAAAAKATIDEFIGASPGAAPAAGATGRVRPGLGTKAVVTADFRSNSLIVQASPRDMAEVSLLIQKIDVADSDAVAELRVFKLENSLADELAPILQNAINGQAGGARQGGQQQLQIPGLQQPGLQQGGGQTGQQAKSTVLRFLTLDAAGQRKLQSGILTDVKITADPRANALLVSAPAQSMDLIEALVRQLDRIPAAVAQIKVFTIVNGDATSMVDMLEALFGQAQQLGGRLGIGQQGPQQGGGTAVQGDNTLVPLRFSIDQRTNSIVASGAAGDLSIVEAILLRLDESDVRQRKNHVYRLKNSPAVDVSNAVNEFLRSQRNVQQIAPQALSPFEQIEREVIVVPEPVSNSLIVSATPRYFDEIQAIVERLDARPPMVTIQVLIAQIALNNIDEFGIELGIQDSVLFDRSLIGNLVTTTTSTNVPGVGQVQSTQVVSSEATPGFNFNNQPLGNNPAVNSERFGPQALTSFAVGRVSSELGYGGLVLSGGNDSLSFLLRALKECRRLEVLSRPQVTTLDNQPAFIQVGQRVPRITGSTVNQAGQTNNVTLENVGLILGVTPRISPDGLVVMEIDAERSEVGPEAQGIPVSISATGAVVRSPRIDTTTAQTTVSALSGQTVVLGGLISKSKVEVHRRVPYLSDTPVIGNLFRYDSVQVQRNELLIIMTPHVIRTEMDNERIKQAESARMSWCLADVNKLYGNSGLETREGEWTDADTTVIYPDADPAGKLKDPASNPIILNPANPGNQVPPPARLPEVPEFPRDPPPTSVPGASKEKQRMIPRLFGSKQAKQTKTPSKTAKSVQSHFVAGPQGEPTLAPPRNAPPQNGQQNPQLAQQPQYAQQQYIQPPTQVVQPQLQQQSGTAPMQPAQVMPRPTAPQYRPEPAPVVWPESPAVDPEDGTPRYPVKPAAAPRTPPAGQRAYYEWQDSQQQQQLPQR